MQPQLAPRPRRQRRGRCYCTASLRQHAPMQLSDRYDIVMLVIMSFSVDHWLVESETGMWD